MIEATFDQLEEFDSVSNLTLAKALKDAGVDAFDRSNIRRGLNGQAPMLPPTSVLSPQAVFGGINAALAFTSASGNASGSPAADASAHGAPIEVRRGPSPKPSKIIIVISNNEGEGILI